MKVNCSIKELICSQSKLASALEISQARVSQLINEGIVIKDPESKNSAVFLFDSIKNYYLNKNTGSGDVEVNYNLEKALYMKAKRELAEFKLSKARGAVYNAKDVEDTFISMLNVLKNNLLTMPSKFARQLEGKNQEQIYAILNDEIEFQLEQLSNFDFSKLVEDVEVDGDED
jgi:phage terminase Nu1 subunit (DNA packaging protein)